MKSMTNSSGSAGTSHRLKHLCAVTKLGAPYLALFARCGRFPEADPEALDWVEHYRVSSVYFPHLANSARYGAPRLVEEEARLVVYSAVGEAHHEVHDNFLWLSGYKPSPEHSCVVTNPGAPYLALFARCGRFPEADPEALDWVEHYRASSVYCPHLANSARYGAPRLVEEEARLVVYSAV